MTYAELSDRNDLPAPAQQKQEWVTPQISLMGAENTEGGKDNNFAETQLQLPHTNFWTTLGPS